ncbi:hypothetical protein OG21DRAFT_1564142 [Imleria badia]|nr:hypothetical protein OG21DRAFT_1564142 [Imleria badia]
MLDPKKQLDITLTEPVVFLRSSDPSGRLHTDPNDSPTLVRGIVTLNVAKPIGVSSIEVELTGVLSISYVEGIGARRTELHEKQKIYSTTVTVFRADQVPRGRNSTSVGPGLSAANSNEDGNAATTSSRPPSLLRGRSERRDVVRASLDFGPTPPYTVAQPPTPIQSSFGAPGEHPAQTLEELRQALRDNLEGQTHSNGPTPTSSRPLIAFSPSSSTMHSNASSTSNDSLHRENDSRPDDLMHTSPPLEADIPLHNTADELSHVLPHGGPSPFRAHSPENTHGPRPRTRGSSQDRSNTGHSRLHLSLASVLDAVREITSRTSSRSPSAAGLEEGERGRTRARVVAEEQSEGGILEVGEGVARHGSGSPLGPNTSHPNAHTEHREHHLLGLGRVFGLERDYEKDKDGEHMSKEHGESWREFKPGTYSYPISFLLPPDLPPTFSLPRGSLDYSIKAVAHRPGAFTSKLSCKVPLLVVAALAVGAGEGAGAGDPGPLFVEKQWEGKLAYSFGLSARLFLLGTQHRLEAAASERVRANTESLVEAGVDVRAETVLGTTTLDITLLPIEKIKIWRLEIVVDQHIRYVDGRGRALGDEKRRVKLLEVQDSCAPEEMDPMDEEEQTHKNKHKHKQDLTRIPLLPTPISPHRSPLLRYVPPSSDPSILAGPGPYTLSVNIGLPGCNTPLGGDSGLLHFTVKQKNSSVRVDHSFRLVMRVESVGDEDANHHEEGEKKKLFDIAVQTPITILSCRCIPEYQTLPSYSQITLNSLQDRAACPCQPSIVGPTEHGHGHEIGNYLGHVMTPSSPASFESDNSPAADEHRNGRERSRSPSRTQRSGHPHPLTVSLHPHSPSPAGWNRSPSHAQSPTYAQHHHSRSQSLSVSTSHVRAHSQAPSVSTPRSRPPSPLARYERLVSGLESEAGEAPPSYESLASGP